MAVYERRSRVAATLDAVWRLHASADGLPSLTPSWMGLRVESVRGPDGDGLATGDGSAGILVEGSTVTLSVRPFGVGPRTRWTSRIVEVERRDDAAWFRDEMVDGPFPRWVHVHRFETDGGGTVVTDRIEYRLPLVPGPLSAFGRPFLEPLFAYRHRRTRELLDSGGA